MVLVRLVRVTFQFLTIFVLNCFTNAMNFISSTVSNRRAPKRVTCCGRITGFLSTYWRSIIVCTVPFLFLPVMLFNEGPVRIYFNLNNFNVWINGNWLFIFQAYRCMYVVLVMSMFWVTEALPLPITSMIPMVAFPVLGILVSSLINICFSVKTEK